MRFSIAFAAAMLLFSAPVYSQGGWDQLNAEIDKGKNNYDLAKMIRLWDEIESGQKLSGDKLRLLNDIAQQPAKRQMGVDEQLYGTVFAIRLQNRYKQIQKEAEEKAAQEKLLQETQKQIDGLKQQVEQLLKTNSNGKPKTTQSP